MNEFGRRVISRRGYLSVQLVS